MYFEIYREGAGGMIGALQIGSNTGQWRWRLKAANREIIAHGESYTTEANCRRAIELVKSTNAFSPVNRVAG